MIISGIREEASSSQLIWILNYMIHEKKNKKNKGKKKSSPMPACLLPLLHHHLAPLSSSTST